MWTKCGQIYCANNENSEHFSHAQVPTPMYLDGFKYRIFYSARDVDGKTRPFFLDYDFEKNLIINLQTKALLSHGAPGSFDDSGIMPSSIIQVEKEVWMYYIAWNPQVTTSYRTSIGLAISSDGGTTFRKAFLGPLLDRNIDEPFFNTAPCVVFDAGIFHMWYSSCTGWLNISGRLEPVYFVRHASSTDGVRWVKDDQPSIDYRYHGEAIGRPWVIEKSGYREMWYSHRGSYNYRIEDGQRYKIGYAQSQGTGLWVRMDEKVNISISDHGWDSEMIEYCSVLTLPNGEDVMLYNGNSFGKTGFGYAKRRN